MGMALVTKHVMNTSQEDKDDAVHFIVRSVSAEQDGALWFIGATLSGHGYM